MTTFKHFLKQTALPAYLQLRGWYYRGNKVSCPCCKGNFSSLVVIGYDKRPAQCPRCRSNERDRTLWLFLERTPGFIFPGIKLLHVAPEEIFYKRFSKDPDIKYTPGDKFINMYEGSYGKDTIYLDITDMPQIPDNTYDLVLCSHVIGCIPDDSLAIREMRRVLKPGGKAIIQVPVNEELEVTHEDLNITDPAERIRIFGDPNYVRYYGRDYRQKLEAQGFKTAFVPLSSFASDEEIKKYGLVKQDDIQLCSK